MSIHKAFSNYQLTNYQTQLVNKLEDFLNNKNQKCFLLRGYAGTGKTFIVKGLTEYFRAIGRSYILAAPTGKASKVIAVKTMSPAYTIHKTIYSNKDIKGYKDLDGTETYKFYFDLNVNNDPATTVYIIDEASMIADIYQEAEFFRFGSGFILRDLLKYINLDNNDHDKKIILIGDDAQLPPVGMGFSPALNEKYLLEIHQLKTISFELAEVVRQVKDSGIFQNSIKIRELLKEKTFNQLYLDMNFSDIRHIEHGEFMRHYLESCNSKINGESIVIAYSNASVYDYNKQIRQHFFPNQEAITVNDKIMVVSNNNQYGLFISNGDFGLVKAVDSTQEKRPIRLKRKTEDKVEEINVQLIFRKINIEFRNLENENKAVFFDCVIIENLLYSEKANLSSDEHKALYVDFCIRHPYLKPNTKEFKDTIKNDIYFNALRVKFGYAITCHKAQGSEWNNVFVNCKTHMSCLNENYFRWLYTAITRAKSELYTLDEPHIKLGGNMKEAGLPFNDDHSSMIVNNSVVDTSLNKAELTDDLFEINPENSFLIALLKAITNVIKEQNIKIIDIDHKQYQEVYYFAVRDETARINIFYKGTKQISNITSQNQNELSNRLVKILMPLHHKIFITKPISESFEFSEPFLKEFYERLLTVVEPVGINIVKITPYEWRERYMFSRGEELAMFDFHYNGKKQFTKYEQKKESTSAHLVSDIKTIFSTGLQL